MALFSRIFHGRKSTRSPTTRWYTPEQNASWNEPALDTKQIRLVLYRDHDLKGRNLIFDSKAVHRVVDTDQEDKKACRFTCSQRKPPPAPDGTTPKYTFTRPGSDTKMLEEMVFGSVALAYRGSTLKVHNIRSPPQLMLSKVFIPVARPTRESTGEGESLDSCSLNYTTPCDLTTPQRISGGFGTATSIAHSVPVDVPTPPNRELALEAEDSGFSTSVNSNASSLTTSIPTPSSSSSMNSNSLTSLHRRWRRNQQTSLEHNILKRQSDEGICDQPVLPAKRPVKIGMAIVFSMKEDETGEAQRTFQKFFFSHITLVEGHFKKLQAAVEWAMYNHRKTFAHQTVEALENFRLLLEDLYLAPRLPEPVWLNMMSYSTHRVVLCQKFLRELMQAVEKYDTKSTKFFLSTVITTVLTHHLAWVPTVTPAGATPSRAYLDKHSAKWLDAVAKSHPYNPLWAQLGDLYGAVGFPLRLSRTVVIGRKADVVSKMLYILSYFIRCSEVLERAEPPHDFESLNPDEVDTASPQTATVQQDSLDGGVAGSSVSPVRCKCRPHSTAPHLGSQESQCRCLPIKNLSESVVSDSSTSCMSMSGSTVVSFEMDSVNVKLKGGGEGGGQIEGVAQNPCRQPFEPGCKVSVRHRPSTTECDEDDGSSNKEDGPARTGPPVAIAAVQCQAVEIETQMLQLLPIEEDAAIRADSGIYEADPVEAKCQWSPKLAKENVKMDRVRHIGRSSFDRDDQDVKCKTDLTIDVSDNDEGERPRCHMSPTQPTEDRYYARVRHVGRYTLATDSGISELAADDLPTVLRDKDDCRNDGAMQVTDKSELHQGAEYAHDSGIFDAGSGTFLTDSQGMVMSLDTTPEDTVSENSDSTSSKQAATVPGSTPDETKPQGFVKTVAFSRTNSMFDEYFEDSEPVSLARPPLPCKVDRFKRMASIEGSNSIFDEYIDVPCPDFTCVTEDGKGSTMAKSETEGTPDSLENSLTMFDEYFGEETSEVSQEKREEKTKISQHLSERRKVARPQALVMAQPQGHTIHQDSQKGNISTTTLTPGRCRAVTPTELGRRRHASSLSNSSSIDADFFLSLKEVNMPSSEPCEEPFATQSYERSFGRSLLAGYSPHYLSDFVLHGTSDTNFQAKLQQDLAMSVQNSVLDEPITEAVCILADVDKWNVRLQACRCDAPDRFQTQEVAASQLVCNIIESVHDLWKLKMSPEFCLMHLEDRLQEIFFKSRTLAEYIRLHKRFNIKQLAALLKFDVSDMPLLLAVAGTHTSHLSLALL